MKCYPLIVQPGREQPLDFKVLSTPDYDPSPDKFPQFVKVKTEWRELREHRTDLFRLLGGFRMSTCEVQLRAERAIEHEDTSLESHLH